MANFSFQSQNLVMRRFVPNDSAFIFDLLNTSPWKQFIGDRSINTLADALNYINTGPLASYARYGYGPWLVTLKGLGGPIGMCGLFKRGYLDGPDLGFAFMPEFEGKGYAYESSMAAINYVSLNFQLRGLYATTMENNLRSRRLLERCGFINRGAIKPDDMTEELGNYIFGCTKSFIYL